jgi:uncharacterized protein (TIGR03435 family)
MKSQRWLWSYILVVGMVVTLSAQTSNPTFEVASIKKWIPGPPSGLGFRQADGAFDRDRITVAGLVEFAFELPDYRVVGGQDWIRRDNFEVRARGDKAASLPLIRLMVQALLRERFMLRSHFEQREMASYTLSMARPDGRLGAGLKQAADATCRSEISRPRNVPSGAMQTTGCGPLSNLATRWVAGLLRSPVVDRTGLTGTYEWSFFHSRDAAGRSRR